VFRRLQCTPDLLPSDVTGVSVFDQRTTAFEFRPGPIFANVLMADEINRATPRTQSAVLEAMQERQVSVDGATHPLPRPFTVIATQNPVELEGTFPLPEAQLDRFLVCLRLGYPDESDERRMLTQTPDAVAESALPTVLAADEILALHAACRQVQLVDELQAYLVSITRATRDDPAVRLGASPRATRDLYRACQVWAATQGRAFATHDAAAILGAILDRQPVPVEPKL
jgi:MoxR-like ATPase